MTVLHWHLPLSYVRSNPTIELLTVFYRTVLLGEPPNLTQHEGPLDIEDHTWTQNVIGFYFNFMTSWEGYTFLIWCFHHARKPCRFYFEMVCFYAVSWIFCRLREYPCFFPSDSFLISWAGKITGKFSSNLVFSVWSIAKNQSLKIFQGKAQIIKWTLENIIFHCNWIIHINAYKRIKDKWNKGIWNEKKESLKWDSKNSLSSAFWIFLFVKKELVSISTFWYSGSNITTFSSDDLLEFFFFFCNFMKYLKYTNFC